MKTSTLGRAGSAGLGAVVATAALFAQSSIFDGTAGGFAGDGLSAAGSMVSAPSTVVAPPAQASVAAPPAATAKPSAPVEKTPPVPEITKRGDGYWQVSFQNLASFSYVAPPPDGAPTPGEKRDIPPNVQALEGKRVRLSGYMLPIKLDARGFVTAFLLIRSPMMCCYGVVPAPNEWVVVKMSAKAGRVPPMMDVPLNFYGTLHVGEVYEEKMFAGIYAMDGDKVSVN